MIPVCWWPWVRFLLLVQCVWPGTKLFLLRTLVSRLSLLVTGHEWRTVRIRKGASSPCCTLLSLPDPACPFKSLEKPRPPPAGIQPVFACPSVESTSPTLSRSPAQTVLVLHSTPAEHREAKIARYELLAVFKASRVAENRVGLVAACQ